MNDHNRDTALGDTTPSAAPATGSPAGGAFVSPVTELHLDLDATKVWTIEDVLNEAEFAEKRARICLKANLQARYDEIMQELSSLVNVRGELIVDEEAAVGETTPAARARELNDELTVVQKQMAASMWFPLFRGMSSDDFAVFQKEHQPKSETTGWIEYYNKLIAACSVEPKLSVDDVAKLRKKLGPRQVQELIETATEVCARGGVDVPKLPGFLRNLADG